MTDKTLVLNQLLRIELASLILLLTLFSSSFAANDFALRPELDIAGPLAKDLSWGWKLETEMNSNVQSASALNLLARLSWQPRAWLSVTPEMLYGTKGGDPQGREWRPRLGIEIGKKLGATTLAARSRAEYRMKNDKDGYWRIRARLKIKLPKVAGCKPFIYDEIFYEAGSKNELNSNEAGIGAGIPLMDGVSVVMDLRFLDSKQDNQWLGTDIHLLSTFEVRF